MDLNSLRTALEPLTKFGQDEFFFEVEGSMVHLRPLLPAEEVKCQQYSAAILKDSVEDEGNSDDDPLTRATTLRYFDQFRTEVISFALVQVGNHDFRQVKYIETGEKTEGGQSVRIPLQRALRDLITETWSRAMITICFAKYGDMITQIAQKADKIAKESLADLDAEIDRVESRLEYLRKERKARAEGDPSVTTQQIQALVRAGEVLESEIQDAIDESRADQELAQALREAAEESPAPEPEIPGTQPQAAPRQSVIPDSAPPPTAPPPEPEIRSSFGDLDDPDSQKIEQDRILAAQQAAQAASRQDLENSLSQAIPEGQLTGEDGKPVDVYRLPSETISERGRREDRSKAQVDKAPGGGEVNPNFKPRKR